MLDQQATSPARKLEYHIATKLTISSTQCYLCLQLQAHNTTAWHAAEACWNAIDIAAAAGAASGALHAGDVFNWVATAVRSFDNNKRSDGGVLGGTLKVPEYYQLKNLKALWGGGSHAMWRNKHWLQRHNEPDRPAEILSMQDVIANSVESWLALDVLHTVVLDLHVIAKNVIRPGNPTACNWQINTCCMTICH
eukprot:jgi/Chlat1/5386/Chrsp35S05302